MDVAVVRERLALAAQNGLSTTTLKPKLQALAYVPATVNPPTFYVDGVTIDYFPPEGAGRLIQYTFTGKLLLGKPDEQAAQKRLDIIVSSGALRSALEADGTLGGACEDMQVRGVTDYGSHEVAGVDYLGVNVEIRVWGWDHT